MSNVINLKDKKTSELAKLSEAINKKLNETVNDIMSNNADILIKHNISFPELVGFIGSGIAHAFALKILADKVNDGDFDLFVHGCKNDLKESLVSGYLSYLDGYFSIINKARTKWNIKVDI